MIVFSCQRRRQFGLSLAVALGFALVARQAQAAEDGTRTAGPRDALQVIADVTLIDGACKGLTVNFGTVFRFATLQGIAISSVMPTGSRRSDFERVLQMRQISFDREELCGQVAQNYAEALPGSVTGFASRNAEKP